MKNVDKFYLSTSVAPNNQCSSVSTRWRSETFMNSGSYCRSLD